MIRKLIKIRKVDEINSKSKGTKISQGPFIWLQHFLHQKKPCQLSCCSSSTLFSSSLSIEIWTANPFENSFGLDLFKLTFQDQKSHPTNEFHSWTMNSILKFLKSQNMDPSSFSHWISYTIADPPKGGSNLPEMFPLACSMSITYKLNH